MATTSEYPQLLAIEFEAEDGPWALRFTPDEQHLIVGCDKSVQVWRLGDDKQVMKMPMEGLSNRVAASGDGRLIAAGTVNGQVFIWDAATHKQVFVDRSRANCICEIDFSADSTHLVTADADLNTATVWDIATGQQVQTLGHSGVVIAALYSPKGDWIASATPESVQVWDSKYGQLLADVNVGASILAWCNNRLSVVTSDDARRAIKQINVATGSVISEWPFPGAESRYSIDGTPHGKFIAYAAKKIITFRDPTTYSPFLLIQHTCDIRDIASSESGQILAISTERQVIVIDLSSVTSRFVLEPPLDIDSTALNAWKLGHLPEADALLSAEISTSGNNVHHALASRALVRSHLGDRDAALADAKQSIKTQRSIVGYIAKCVALVSKGEMDKAIWLCDVASRHFHSENPALLNLIKGVILFMSGKHVDAISHMGGIINDGWADLALYTVQAYMHHLSGNMDMQNGNYKRAIQSFESARIKLGNGTRQPPQIITLMTGWNFDNLAITNEQRPFEALFIAGRTKEAAELLLMINEETNMTESAEEWLSRAKSQCYAKLEDLGDRAIRAREYAKAESSYELAISLDPGSQDLLARRDKAREEREMWESALDDANDEIDRDPSSPSGYEKKYTALHGMGCDKDAIDEFETMLSKMSESSDPDINERFKVYSQTKEAINKSIENATSDLPFVLINASSGRMYDKSELADAFKLTPTFTTLVTSMTTLVDHARIEKTVDKFFRYATFSHTWQGEEPSYEKVINIVVYDLETSPNHDKLRMFCKIAQELGFNWAWSDTCCIDQGNRQVHEKSLVLMFKWYEGSAMTIIYLFDVEDPMEIDALTRSRWNTRGWTLQEYHASEVVRIYTRYWEPYRRLTIANYKESPEIIKEMKEATGISARDLKSLRPGLNHIRQKLCLASKRQTKEVEDGAYSLLGIFKMSLRVTYGERDMALGRFLSQLLMNSGDTSILAWTGASGSFNSSLPTDIRVFSELPIPHIPPAISDDDVTSPRLPKSRLDLDLATKLFDKLHDLSIPYFDGQRMKLPCIAFRIKRLFGDKPKPFELAAATLEEDVDIKAKQSLGKPDSLYLVHPWMDFLLDRRSEEESPGLEEGAIFRDSAYDVVDGAGSEENSTSSSAEVDKQTLVCQFLVRLGQPFGALLLKRTRTNTKEYKRIATENSIRLRVKDITSSVLKELIKSVQTLDVI